MSIKPKMRLFAGLLSVTMLGISQSAIPMPSETSPMHRKSAQATAQPLTQDELEFLVGTFHAQNSGHPKLAYLDQREMATTEGRLGRQGL